MYKSKNSSLNSDDVSSLTLQSGEHSLDLTRAVLEDENLNKSPLQREIARVLNELNLHLITISQQGIIIYDRNLTYALWNSAMEEMTGLLAADVVGKHHSALF